MDKETVEKLMPQLQQAVRENKISFSHMEWEVMGKP